MLRDFRGDVTKHMTDLITGKRKRDNAPEPAHALQQTPKKPKTHHMNEQPAKQSHAGHKRKDGQAQGKARKVRSEKPAAEPTEAPPKVMEPEELPKISPKDEDDKDELTHKAENLKKFMHDVRMHPEDPDGSSKVVYLAEQGEDRVLTVSTLKTGRTVMHDTSIPHKYGQSRIPTGQPSRAEEPFLKKGKHGRNGDFVNDPDRRTGRGHQCSAEDQQGLEEYHTYRGQVLKEYPKYPKIGEDQDINPKVETDWNENEDWYRRFAQKYPAHAVSHLWPCGCEKLRGESEDEESEEE